MNIIDPKEYFTRFAKRKTPKKLRSVCPIERVKLHNRGGGSAYRNTKTGYREDIGDNNLFRSGWEADLARICVSYSIPYQYEPQLFSFPVKQRNTKGYVPDFKMGIQSRYEWLELKGWLEGGHSITKLRRFRIYYPDEFARLTLVVNRSPHNIEVCEKIKIPQVMFWGDIKRTYENLISNWESN